MLDRLILSGLSTLLVLGVVPPAGFTLEEQTAPVEENFQRSLSSDEDLATDTAEIAATEVELDQIKLKQVASGIQPSPSRPLIQLGGSYDAEPGPAEPHMNRILILLQREQ